ncbi:hypothetical protein [Saccharomonospora sp. NB11]|uniref:hypothetical protein n=1 Tax=Saccharomonospora sp. NB11 TaxID=1642298 RepID=UPI0018D13524|nr:hypothetical protein [Saccharomonospora sp. NB11]
MRTRQLAVVATVAVAVYLVLLAGRAVELLRSGEPVAVALGVGVLVLPLLGAWMLVATWRSGLAVQRLSRRLEAEGGLPDTSDLPRRPSGRVDREAADAWFELRRAEVEKAPDDWRAWYRLAYAYDIAGDRKRARGVMRKAVELEAAESESAR